MEPTFCSSTGSTEFRNLDTFEGISEREKASKPLAHGTLFCLSPGSLLSSRALRSGVKNQKQNAGNPLKGVFASFQYEYT